jgi:hypothetical protein
MAVMSAACEDEGSANTSEESQEGLALRTGFVTQWTVSGDAAARTIRLPLAANSTEKVLAYNFVVNWGDGSSSTVTSWSDPRATHVYATAGTYRVEITGTCEGWSFDPIDPTMALKLTNVVSWGRPPKFSGFQYLWAGFDGCANLQSLPSGGIPAAKSGGPGVQSQGFGSTFAGCSKLESLPGDLFIYHPKAADFTNVFQSDTSLTSIPGNIFEYNVNATFFAGAFSYTKLTTVPAGLFIHNPAVTSFNNLFSEDTNLVSIPADLFRYNPAVTTFDGAFWDCSNLVSVPNYTFRYNTSKTISFVWTFGNDTKLKVSPKIFYAAGEEKTRFANNTSTNFSGCFYRTSFTGVQGVAPDLWNCTFGGTLNSSVTFGGAGNSVASLSNYASIRTSWK